MRTCNQTAERTVPPTPQRRAALGLGASGHTQYYKIGSWTYAKGAGDSGRDNGSATREGAHGSQHRSTELLAMRD